MEKTVRKINSKKVGDKRQDILDAARRTFLRKGLPGASIAAVCKEARISPGHLYHYFDSKEAILEAISEAYLADTRQNFSNQRASKGVLFAITSEIDRTIALSKDANQALLFELIAEASRNPAIAEILQQGAREQQMLLSELIQEGKEAGEIKANLDPELTAAVIITIVDALKIACTRGSDTDPGESARLMSRMLTSFLAP